MSNFTNFSNFVRDTGPALNYHARRRPDVRLYPRAGAGDQERAPEQERRAGGIQRGRRHGPAGGPSRARSGRHMPGILAPDRRGQKGRSRRHAVGTPDPGAVRHRSELDDIIVSNTWFSAFKTYDIFELQFWEDWTTAHLNCLIFKILLFQSRRYGRYEGKNESGNWSCGCRVRGQLLEDK